MPPHPQSVEVTRAYTSQYPDPICFEAGDVVQVERGDPDTPGWFWCRASSGKEGWVHRSFLEDCVGLTKSVQRYSARELTVEVGARGTLLHALDGWVCIRLEDRDEGWVPLSHVEISE